MEIYIINRAEVLKIKPEILINQKISLYNL